MADRNAFWLDADSEKFQILMRLAKSVNLMQRLKVRVRGPIRRQAKRHVENLIPVLEGVGKFSPSAERVARKKLDIAPFLVQMGKSPNGAVLASPIRMTTCQGQDQVSRALAYSGWRGFEYPIPQLFEALFRSAANRTFLDVGANTGLYSLLCKATAQNWDVHAMEPYAPAREILEANIEMNEFAAEIRVNADAAAESAGFAELFIPTQEHGLIETSASLSGSFHTAHSRVVRVSTIPLDDYVNTNCVAPIGVIKIDTEGTEESVLRGCFGTILRDAPIIICEILSDSAAWEFIGDFLTQVDYEIAAIKESGLARVRRRPDEVATNYLLFPRAQSGLVRELTNQLGLKCDITLGWNV